jgi:hypothetical protein
MLDGKIADVNTSSLARDRPQIESVFGPLTEAEDQRLRRTLASVDEELLSLAAHFEQDRAGVGGTGLDLRWVKSGQVSIASYVTATVEGGNVVEFYLELRPAWLYGNQTGEAGWCIEASVQADCQHNLDHGGMDTVWDRPETRFSTPIEAVQALAEAARELRTLAEGNPVTYWVSLANE